MPIVNIKRGLMKYKKIALIGMMGCGKTTIAKILAKDLGLYLYESDEIFENIEKISIKDYFNQFGEESFRQKETRILTNISQKENFILSTGGGIILKKENRDLLFNSNICTIYLETSADEIYERIKKDDKRPLLLVENPKEEIKKILNSRKNFYNLAKIKIKTDNKKIEDIIEEIKEILWKE